MSDSIRQVSHNEKLKNLADSNNTNLYVSGIPTDVDFNEHVRVAFLNATKPVLIPSRR